jgi:hypothetical protein
MNSKYDKGKKSHKQKTSERKKAGGAAQVVECLPASVRS